MVSCKNQLFCECCGSVRECQGMNWKLLYFLSCRSSSSSASEKKKLLFYFFLTHLPQDYDGLASAEVLIKKSKSTARCDDDDGEGSGRILESYTQGKQTHHKLSSRTNGEGEKRSRINKSQLI